MDKIIRFIDEIYEKIFGGKERSPLIRNILIALITLVLVCVLFTAAKLVFSLAKSIFGTIFFLLGIIILIIIIYYFFKTFFNR